MNKKTKELMKKAFIAGQDRRILFDPGFKIWFSNEFPSITVSMFITKLRLLILTPSIINNLRLFFNKTLFEGIKTNKWLVVLKEVKIITGLGLKDSKNLIDRKLRIR